MVTPRHIGSTIYYLGEYNRNKNKCLDTIETLDVSSINRTGSAYNLSNSWKKRNFRLKYPRRDFAAVVLQ